MRRPVSRLCIGCVVLLTGCASLVAQECHGPGVARWPIKTSLPEGTKLSRAGRLVSLAQLLSLADPPGVTKGERRFQSARIPQFSNPLGVKEGDVLSTTGWLFLVATESSDCDYHIQISPRPRSAADKPTPDDDCIVVEAPRPEYIADASLRKRSGAVRDSIKAMLLAGREPTNRGSVMHQAVCVKVSGQLFYDDEHLRKNGTKAARGKRGMTSKTLWELHPLTSFRVMPASACG